MIQVLALTLCTHFGYNVYMSFPLQGGCYYPTVIDRFRTHQRFVFLMRMLHTMTSIYNTLPQPGPSRLPGMGVEQLERVGSGEGERDSDWMGARVCGGAVVGDSADGEGPLSCDIRLDLKLPAEGDLIAAAGGGWLCSPSSGIVLVSYFFFFFFVGLFLLFSFFFLGLSSLSDFERPISLANQRHFSRSCSCMRLMQVDSSAMPVQGSRAIQVFNIF